MDLLLLVVVFAVIVIALIFKKPLFVGIYGAMIVAILVYRLPLDVAGSAILKGATSWSTVSTLLVFYAITYLQRLMNSKESFLQAKDALDNFFHNRRINAAVAPFVIGMLPAGTAVLLCGPILRDSVGDSLEVDEQAAITSYFRHITEAFLPTYPHIFVMLTLSAGYVTAGSYFLVMIPMVIVMFAAGWIVYLRKVPKGEFAPREKSRLFYVGMFFKNTWQVFLAVILIMAFKIPTYIAIGISILLSIILVRYPGKDLLAYIKSAFDWKMLLSNWACLTFKEVLIATGVITKLPDYFSKLPLPTYICFMLIFFVAAAVATNNAIIPIFIPMVISMATPGQNMLPMIMLVMSATYIAMQITPMHVCISICADDYKIPLGRVIKKIVPMALIDCAAAIVYYLILVNVM